MERNIYKIRKELFVTSDEEIKLNDYITDSYKVWKWKDNSSLLGRKKVILTTNQDLIADGVQTIDDEFLEWLVNNPTCEFVKVDLIPVNTFGSEITVNGYGFDKFIYKITIPQETLEQVAEKWYSPFGFYPDPKQGFIAGAEWQTEKMYSEEEVLKLLYKRPNFINMTTAQKQEETKYWFEQFKKK
jgi:hypothetical protein